MAKRVEPARTGDERRRGPRQAAAQRRSGDAPPRSRRSTREQRPQRPERSKPHTSPMPRPAEGTTRPKNTAQAKARSKARKAKAPKVVRIPLRERLLVKIASIDFDPRRFVTRVPFVVLVIGALGLGLGVTLWLSTDAAQRSYQLGHARQVNQALMQQKDGLERQVLEAQAAPALAEAARDLGMIPSRDTAHLVQDPAGNWIVVGTPKPAEGVPPPPLNSPLPEPTTPGPPPPPAPRVVEPREVAVHVPPTSPPLPNAGAPVPATAAVAPVAPDQGAVAVPPVAAGVPVPLAEVPAPAASPADAAPHLEPLQMPALPGPTPNVEPLLPVPAPGAPRMSRGARRAKAPNPKARMTAHSASERRIRKPRQTSSGEGSRSASFVFRHRVGNGVMLLVLLLAAGQLFMLQVPRAEGLRAEAAGQLKVTDVEKAVRGSIVDRNDDKLAFTTEARALTFQPVKVQSQLADAKAKVPDSPEPAKRLREIAKGVAGLLNNKPDADTLYKKLISKDSFVYLARAVDPAISDAITGKYPEVGAERQDIRQYPGGSLAANIVGGIDWDGHGLLGLEDSLDSKLAGTDGSVTYDRGSDGVVIPGSYRNRHDSVNGSTIQLTIDDDIQFYVQQQVQQAKSLSGAKNVSAVVLDSKTGEVLAMSNDDTFDPSQDIGRQEDRELNNLAVTSPFEPGSVNKIITASTAIDMGLTNPDEVLQVPGSIDMGGVTVRDAWGHGVMPYTTTGVFGKSSNVGTLMLAQRIGPQRYAEMLAKFGLGQRTGVGLPGESSGLVPPIDQWSGSSFANLPIGQGLSMTLLQMTGMYQAIANDGVRIPPRIIKSTIASDGTRSDEARPEGIRVVSPETAASVRNMLRATVQRDPTGVQQGTGSLGAVEGYQIAAKTGTAQQINPGCGCYYDDVYWITFAGMVPADDPRYVVGVMMDNPHRTADGSPGTTAAPLFHNIAAWLLQRENVPLSPDPGPPLVLQG